MERPERPMRSRRNNRYREQPARSDSSQNSRKSRGDRGKNGQHGGGYRGKENDRYGGGRGGRSGMHGGRGRPNGGQGPHDRRDQVGRGGFRGPMQHQYRPGNGGTGPHPGGYRGGGMRQRGKGRNDRGGGAKRTGGVRRGKREMCRFQERANGKLVEAVKHFNRYDMAGPHQVRMKLFTDTTWTARQSLTSGSFYFYDRATKRTTRKRPADLVGKEEIKEIFDDQGSRFLKRPTKYPDNMNTILVRTNTYQISGNILNFKVHQYFVEFDPPIPTTDFQRRQNVLLGNTRKEQTRHREILQNLFGPFEFDNHCLYALGEEPVRGEKVLEDLHPDFKVKFYLQDSLCLRSDDVPLTQREALLNIFNRKKLKNAGLSKIGRGWYCRSSRDPVDLQREVNIEYDIPGIPDVKIISGYDASIRVSSTLKNDDEQVVFKADLNHRLVTLRTVHDIIMEYRQRYPRTPGGDEDFRRAVETRLEKKNFILTYSNRHITIAKVDWTQDQNATFVLQTGGKISYKDYLERQYHVQSNKKELCVIRDRSDSAFLPQHMRLTVTPTELGKVYDDILDNINVPIQERLDRIDHLVHRINQDDEEQENLNRGGQGRASEEQKTQSPLFAGGHVPIDFRIAENGLEVKAVELDMPSITIQTGQGLQAFRIDELKWHLTRGFLNKAPPLAQWRVIYHRDSEDKANRIRAMWQEYCSRRNFNAQTGPIRCPYMHPIPTWDPQVCRNVVDRNDQMILLLLPNGDDGSKFKSLFTKIIQSHRFHNPVHVQCITEYQCSNKFAVLSIFEAMLAKHGHVLYHIDPVLPSDTKILVDSTWIMGLDVSHVQGKPSVCMLSLSRRPLEGSMRSLHFCAHLNTSGREIVPLVNMSMMVCQILEEAVICAHREGQRLPSSIWFFRDGVADSQLKELHTKEVSGLQRGIKLFCRRQNVSKWKCKLEYVIVAKNVVDRFGMIDHRRRADIRSPDRPCVLHDYVMSDRVWDFILYPWHPRNDKVKGVRCIVLKDDLNLADGGAVDMFQFIYSLTYLYVFSLPFQNGGLSQPAPIKYAKKYAETFGQMITKDDVCLEDLILSSRLNRPHVVHVIDEEGLSDLCMAFTPEECLE